MQRQTYPGQRLVRELEAYSALERKGLLADAKRGKSSSIVHGSTTQPIGKVNNKAMVLKRVGNLAGMLRDFDLHKDGSLVEPMRRAAMEIDALNATNAKKFKRYIPTKKMLGALGVQIPGTGSKANIIDAVDVLVFLRTEYGLSADVANSMASATPRLLRLTSQEIKQRQLYLGLDNEKFIGLIKKRPMLALVREESLEAKRKVFSLTHKEFSTAILLDNMFAFRDLQKTRDALLKAGVPRNKLRGVVNRFPRIAGVGSGTIGNRGADLGFTPSQYAEALVKKPSIIGFRLETLRDRIDFYASKAGIGIELCAKYPDILTYSNERITKRVEAAWPILRELRPQIRAVRLVTMLRASEARFEQMYSSTEVAKAQNNSSKTALDKLEAKYLSELRRLEPAPREAQNYSLELCAQILASAKSITARQQLQEIEKKVRYYVLNFDIGAADFERNPKLLEPSLAEVIIPRMEAFVQMGGTVQMARENVNVLVPVTENQYITQLNRLLGRRTGLKLDKKVYSGFKEPLTRRLKEQRRI